jgi:hypothetical protein
MGCALIAVSAWLFVSEAREREVAAVLLHEKS